MKKFYERVVAAEAAIAAALGIRTNTLSAHLTLLTRAGLIAPERDGRSIRYRAELGRMRQLIGFLLEDCCQGRPEICAPLLSAIACDAERMTS